MILLNTSFAGPALAEAARPFLGQFGFRLIAIAALFSTASAIEATRVAPAGTTASSPIGSRS